MASSRRCGRVLVGLLLLSCSIGALAGLLAGLLAQNGGMMPGQSISWRPVTSPFTPDANQGAIAGGPGNDPNPGTPMFLCRARVQNSLTPGKWVQGNCNVAFGGSEQIMRSYEVAYGARSGAGIAGTSMGWLRRGEMLTAARCIRAA